MILKDVAIVKGGKRLPKTDELVSHKTAHPYIRIRDMYQSYPLELNSDFEYITDETYEKIKRYIVNQGDVIVAVVGNTIGLVSLIGESLDGANLTENCNKLVNLKNYNNKFLYYFLTSKQGQDEIRKGIVGSSQPKLPIYNIEKFEIPDVHIDTQIKIVSVLESIDKKIKVNEQINRNLEDQAKLLYKSWFIDFENNGDEMPSDWHNGTVEEIIELHDSIRKPLSGNERDKLEKIYPYYGATSIMDYVDNYLFDGIYLLLGEDGSVMDANGYPILQYVFGKFWVNNHAHVITGKNGFSVEELYLLFGTTNVQNIVTGAVQLKINQQNLKNIEVVIPSKEALMEFDEIIQPMFGQIRNLRLENDRLKVLRDSLLPKLMSGELDVSDIDI
jgi:type I restriction enzyme S subunit